MSRSDRTGPAGCAIAAVEPAESAAAAIGMAIMVRVVMFIQVSLWKSTDCRSFCR
jgi:hypothetical protein